MALTKSDERDIERLTRAAVKDELEKHVEKIVREQLKGNKQLEKYVLQIVKNATASLYKTMWMRRATWLSGIENNAS